MERLRRRKARARRNILVALATVIVLASTLMIGMRFLADAHDSKSSSTPPPAPAPTGARPPRKAQAVARYLKCQSSYKDTTPVAREARHASPISSGSCNLGGTAVVIDVYDDRGTRQAADGDAERIACDIPVSSRHPRFWYVDGDNFILFLSSESRADDVAKLIDSTAVRVECDQ